MAEQETGETLPAVPPTRPGEVRMVAQEPYWHVPVGAGTIILGLAGTVVSAAVLFSTVVEDPGPRMSMLADGRAVLRVLGELGMLAGGIGVVCRRRWSVWVLLVSAVARVVVDAIGVARALAVPDMATTLAGVAWIVWLLGWPGFLAVWLALRAAEVRRWGAGFARVSMKNTP